MRLKTNKKQTRNNFLNSKKLEFIQFRNKNVIYINNSKNLIKTTSH